MRAGTHHPDRPSRHGSVIIVVLWAIAIAAVVVGSIQLFSHRQATMGREVLHRVQSRWAARAGLERTISILALHTESPIPEDAFAMVRDMEGFSEDQLFNAGYDIRHHAESRDWRGPMDESSRMNINRVGASELGILDDITPDIVAAIVDWADQDEEVSLFGAERDYYLTLATPYEPRNEPYRSVAELEMVAGIKPYDVRGEDWNLNSRRDMNEDDGERSYPVDDPNGVLEAGWSEWLTAYSVDGGATPSGLPRLFIRSAEPVELMERLGIEEDQATLLIAYSRSSQNTLEQLITTPLNNIDAQGRVQSSEQNPDIAPLDDEQLRAVLAETSIVPLFDRRPGKINLNTAPRDMILELLATGLGQDPVLADEIIYMRDSRAEGITSILDLRDLPDFADNPALLQTLAGIFTAHSNVYTIAVGGRCEGSGTRSEIIAVVDRSSLPIRILEYREQ